MLNRPCVRNVRKWSTTQEMEGIRMTSAAASLDRDFPGAISDDNNTSAARDYLTKTAFVAVHFDVAGKGRIDFLPQGALFQVFGRSSCLPSGFEVVCDQQHYHVFEIDVLVRSIPTCEPIRAKRKPA